MYIKQFDRMMEGFVTGENSMTPDEIQRIHEIFQEIPAEQATVGMTANALRMDVRNSRVCWVKDRTKYDWLYERVQEIVVHINDIFFNVDVTWINDIQLTEYESGENGNGMFNPHMDSCWGVQLDGGNVRKLSVVIQLSDEKDYDGGELQIFHSNIDNPAVLSKNPGDMVMFRSHIIHGVTPVTRGRRRSLVAWVGGPSWR